MTLSVEEILDELSALCRIPSIAFPGFDASALEQSAQAIAKLCRRWGWPQVMVVRNSGKIPGQGGAPAVIASWGEDPRKPTILLYAHHDVQPELRAEKWITPAFEPALRGGRLYARGAADDKAGVLIHLATARRLFSEYPDPPINLRLLIEGEEEVGSPGLAQLLRDHREFLFCNAVIVADLGNFAPGEPALTASLRGMTALEVEVRAMSHPVHSGLWSGPIPDPAQGLCKMLASLSDDAGRPVFIETPSVPSLDELERSYDSLPLNLEKFRKEAGLCPSCDFLCPPEKIRSSLWLQPSVTVTSIEGGKRGQTGNVLLDSAWARISVRLAPGMSWEKTLNALENHLRRHCPWGLEMRIHREEGADAWVTATDHPWFSKMLDALSAGYGKPARIIGCGASIPGAPLFSDVFGKIPVLMTGIEDSLSNAHGENESVSVDDLLKAIQSQYLFLSSLSS